MFSGNSAQEVEFWVVKTWFLAWRYNLGFPDFALPLERGLVTLERGIRASSIFLNTVLQSARAEDWALERRHVSQARAGGERPSSGDFPHPVLLQYARAGYLTLERVPLLHDRSSGETCTRAGLCFSEKSENAFKRASLHPHPILSTLRPSLRHLHEGVDVEHTEAN